MALRSNEKSSVWLSPEVLRWPSYGQGGKQPPVNVRVRAYEIWRHAENLLQNATSDLQLVDAITAMKRLVDHRIRALDKAYAFRSIPIKDKPSELLVLKSNRIETRAEIIERLKADGNSVWKSHEESQADDIFVQADVRGLRTPLCQ